MRFFAAPTWRLVGLITALTAASGLTAARPIQIEVLAASSLTNAFDALALGFHRAHPGVRILTSYGASSLIRVQIEQGIPADLFASADSANMRPLVTARLALGPVFFAGNRLVIVTPARNPAHIRSLGDLARSGVRLVLTERAVPIGRYTREVLTAASATGHYGTDFGARVERNAVSQEPNVRALLVKVELGEVDAAIVYASDARIAGSRVHVVSIPANLAPPVAYPLAILTSSAQPALAREFVSYVISATGQGILKQYGFLPAHGLK
jgi:molybdate transport system substrate-binding protein